MPTAAKPYGVAFDRAGKRIFVSAALAAKLQVFSADSLQLLAEAPTITLTFTGYRSPEIDEHDDGTWVEGKPMQKLYENGVIDGLTGIAFDPFEDRVGPIELQGDHNGGIEFRNIVLVPLRNPTANRGVNGLPHFAGEFLRSNCF